tara:strand:+ start:9 stop:605 length:597 start_codon:yes stop_codon:yes gene_type:complete
MIILIDNYDSFTYNLVHYFGELGNKVRLFKNDEKKASELIALNPKAIVISPGPCNPDKAGISLDITLKAASKKIPLLGVCLGHQTIGQAFGSKILSAKEIVHGKTDKIYHSFKGIFKNIPSPFLATRYHSLSISKKSLPNSLEITAETNNGEIMAIQHKKLPIYGVQFHPESIMSEHGHLLLKNFIDIINNIDGKKHK